MLEVSPEEDGRNPTEGGFLGHSARAIVPGNP